jgi:hypothetical protein
MTQSNILPYDGQAILIDANGAEFDWPAITQTLIDTIPRRVETARIFGRDMPIPRMTAWFGDGTYFYTGILHLPAPFPQSLNACVNVPKRYRAAYSMPLWSTSIGTVATASGRTMITRPDLGTAQP